MTIGLESGRPFFSFLFLSLSLSILIVARTNSCLFFVPSFELKINHFRRESLIYRFYIYIYSEKNFIISRILTWLDLAKTHPTCNPFYIFHWPISFAISIAKLSRKLNYKTRFPFNIHNSFIQRRTESKNCIYSIYNILAWFFEFLLHEILRFIGSQTSNVIYLLEFFDSTSHIAIGWKYTNTFSNTVAENRIKKNNYEEEALSITKCDNCVNRRSIHASNTWRGNEASVRIALLVIYR